MYRVTIEREPPDSKLIWAQLIDDGLVGKIIDAWNRIIAEDELRKANNSGGAE